MDSEHLLSVIKNAGFVTSAGISWFYVGFAANM
jgi:hypothetical protein